MTLKMIDDVIISEYDFLGRLIEAISDIEMEEYMINNPGIKEELDVEGTR